MAAIPPTGGPKNAAAPDECWALTLRHYNSRTKRLSSFWKKPRKFGGRMWRASGLLGFFCGSPLFVLFGVLFRVISPSRPRVVWAPSVRPFFVWRRYGATRRGSFLAQTRRQWRRGEPPFCQTLALLLPAPCCLLFPPHPLLRLLFFPPIRPAASRFLRSNFRKLQRGADASADFLQTSRFSSAARPPRAFRHFELRTS